MKSAKVALLLLAYTCSSHLVSEKVNPPLLYEDFSQPETRMAKELLSNPSISLMKGAGPHGENAIRVAYVGFDRGSERIVAHMPLSRKVRNATLRFDVYFEENFQWTSGGKLLGLGPVQPVTGGKDRRPDGWSARVMFKEEGKLSTYLYDQDPNKKWGFGGKTTVPVLKKQQWHRIELQLQINNAGDHTGSTIIRVDGQEVLKTQEVQFRGKNGDETLISQFLFSTFHGGNQPGWSPRDSEGTPTTVYARFANILVLENE